MAEKLTIKLTGDLEINRDGGNTTNATDAGQAFALAISDATKAGDLEISQRLATIDSAGSPLALPFPANLEGRLLFMLLLTKGDVDVTVTHAVQGATVYPVKKLLILEPSEDEFITGVSVQGVADICWICTGTEV